MVDAPLWSTFRTLAERVGDVPAILAPAREHLLFRDLPSRLEAVRDSLAALGIGRGDRIISILPRGPETAVCFLGVAASATYVPLNPDFSEAEFTSRMTALRPKAVIVPTGEDSAATRCAEALGIAVLELVARFTDPAGTFSLVPRSGVPAGTPRTPEWNSGEDIALVLLTSGSTEQPKAVPLRVCHLLDYARVAAEHYGLGPNDRCLHVMPMFHGHGLKSSLLVPLTAGCGVICAPAFDIPSFFQLIKTLRPTWYSAASSIHHAVAAHIHTYRDVARDAKLRFIRSGSSRLDPKVMSRLQTAFAAPVLERYGMSEAGTIAANGLGPTSSKLNTVGRPMANEVAIIDDSGLRLPANCEGEIVVRGPSVFDGYLDNETANRAAFVDGWFRTGDLGRLDDDGYLVLTGRVKDLINRGGEKIGPAEIESALLRHPAVSEACAFAIPHPSLGEEVAAAVATTRTVSEHELRVLARSMLANIKVPRRIFFLASLPKGPTNKVRRDQTAALCRDLLAKDSCLSEPAGRRAMTMLEHDIARAWGRVLGRDVANVDDDFFLLGGDSLKAYQLFAQLRTHYSVTLGLRQIFEDASTVAGMARLIERANQERRNAAQAGVVTIKVDGHRPPLFAMPGSGGNPIGWVHVGRLIDPNQPLIGLEARGIDGADEPLGTVEDIAADNIARIRMVQPKGPYFLTGACFGGRVAYEMARQLEAAGEPIGMLLMLDPSPPFLNARGQRRGEAIAGRRASPRGVFFRVVFRRLVRQVVSLFALKGRERRAFLRDRIAVLRGMFEHRDIFRGERSELHQWAVYAANRRAGRLYVPGSFSGPTILCLTRVSADGTNPRLAWLDLLPQVGSPVYLDGTHSGNMLNLPHVYGLAERINGWLDAAQSTPVHAEARASSHALSAE